jgi:hypothetical protein
MVQSGTARAVDSLVLRVGDAEAEVRLWPHLAPRTVEALVAALPVETDLQHCKWSGSACFADLSGPSLLALEGLESPVTSIYPRTLAVRPPTGPAPTAELLIAYGGAEYRWPDGRAYVTPVGELVGEAGACLSALAATAADGRVRVRIAVKGGSGA